MDNAFRRAWAKRGAVYLIFRVEFPECTKPKYCVLMEDYSCQKADLAVLFTTSRTEYAYQPSSVLVPDSTIGDIDGATLIQCNNARILKVSILLEGRHSKYLGQLPRSVLEEVDRALEHADKLDEATLIRMLKIQKPAR